MNETILTVKNRRENIKQKEDETDDEESKELDFNIKKTTKSPMIIKDNKFSEELKNEIRRNSTMT